MKLNQLTFTRFFAAITIVVYHFGGSIPPFNEGLLHDFFSRANVFVSFFFILSGFVMIIAYSKSKTNSIDYGNYYVNRVARIYPLYFIALLATTLIKPHHIDFKGFLAEALLIQSWIPGYPLRLNYPGWSLSVETFFYLAFPLIFNYVFKRCKLWVSTIGLLIVYVIIHYIIYQSLNSDFYKGPHTNSHDLLFYFPVSNLGEFLLGCLLGLWFLKIPAKYFKAYDVVIIGVFLLTLWLIGAGVNFIFISPLFTLIILFLSLNTGFITRLFSKKVFVSLGEISYGVYILQVPVYGYLAFFNSKAHILSKHGSFYVGFGALILVSYFAYEMMERPLSNYIKSAYGRRNHYKL